MNDIGLKSAESLSIADELLNAINGLRMRVENHVHPVVVDLVGHRED